MRQILVIFLATATLAAVADDRETMAWRLRDARTVAAFEALAQQYLVQDARTARRAIRDAWSSYVRLGPELGAAMIWLPRIASADPITNNGFALALAPLCRTPAQWARLFSHSSTTLGPIPQDLGTDAVSRAHGLVQRALGSCRSLTEIRQVVDSNPAVERIAGHPLIVAFINAQRTSYATASSNDLYWAVAQYRAAGAGSGGRQFLEIVLPRLLEVESSHNALMAILRDDLLSPAGRQLLLHRLVPQTFNEGGEYFPVRFSLLNNNMTEGERSEFFGERVAALASPTGQVVNLETRFQQLRELFGQFANAGMAATDAVKLVERALRSQGTMREYLETISLLRAEATPAPMQGWLRNAVLATVERFLPMATGRELNDLVWESGLFTTRAQREQVITEIFKHAGTATPLAELRLPAFWFRSRAFQEALRDVRERLPGTIGSPGYFSCITTLGGML